MTARVDVDFCDNNMPAVRPEPLPPGAAWTRSSSLIRAGMVRNPVMFVVEVGSVLTTLLWLQALLGHGEAAAGFIGWVAIWLWFTVLFANFAEALAEGRGKAQAEALRRTRQETQAKRVQAEGQRSQVATRNLLACDLYLRSDLR